ncbi:MAG: hypothetical protein ACK5Y2_12170 [Bdellovibrionales bacterium]
MIKKLAVLGLSFTFLTGTAYATESFVACGGASAAISTEKGKFQVWEKVDLELNTEEGYLAYDRYIGIIGQPQNQSYRELTAWERFKLNSSSTRDSGRFTDLQELGAAEAGDLISGINPEDVEKFYTGETFWSGRRGFLIKLKDGNVIFSTGMVYSSDQKHCQIAKK